jgi:hypothetical protein
MSYDLYDESIQIVLEKDGEEVSELPPEITESMEFLMERGMDPNPHLILPESCKPKLGEFLIIQDEDLENDGAMAEHKLCKAIEMVGEEPAINDRSIGFDFFDYPRIRSLSRALVRMKEYMNQKQVKFYFTPRMMREVKAMQEANAKTNVHRAKPKGFGK